jgi:hypothetical protein
MRLERMALARVQLPGQGAGQEMVLYVGMLDSRPAAGAEKYACWHSLSCVYARSINQQREDDKNDLLTPAVSLLLKTAWHAL